MKNLVFKFAFLAMVFIGACTLAAFACPGAGTAVCSAGICLPDISFCDVSFCDAGAVSLATVVALPVCDPAKLCAVTQTVYKDMQAKYGKLYVIDVDVDTGESYQFLLRRPTRQHLELIEHNKNDVSKVNDIIIKNLVVAGNELNALDDGIVFALFNQQAAKIIQQGQAFLSKA
jgi:hypothetical protein